MEAVAAYKAISKFRILEEVLKRKDWVKYKTIPYWHGRVIDKDIIASQPGDKFRAVVEEHVNAYIFQKKEPPAQIETAIMNIADDYINGREPVVKAGDYIAIQNFIRG